MLTINNLEVKYGKEVALVIKSPIVFEEGDRIGIIGSNGAGKTTLVKSILGLINYNGSINISVKSEEIAAHMQFNNYVDTMAVKYIIEAILDTKIKNNKKLQELIDFFDFSDCLKKKYSALSGGQKQRLTLGLRILVPSFASVIILIGSLYLLSIIFFVLAHGIALFIKKFGPTYAITTILYFLIMILSGMFGVQAKDFPAPLMKIAYLFPTTYISSEFADFWQGGSYNFMPYIQSLLLFTAVSAIVLFLAINKDSRYNHREKVSATK